MAKKYEVLKEFGDKHTNLYIAAGGVFEADDERAAELQKLGYLGEEVALDETKQEAPTDQNDQDDPEDDERLNHVGGGYYEMPNGEKVRGKENAIEALKKLDAADDNGDETA